MVDRARLFSVTQTLREARDDLEKINEPHDPRLGDIQLRLAVVIKDLRDLPFMSPMMVRGDLS